MMIKDMRNPPLEKKGEALIEAQRCLDCLEPSCQRACPAHVDIPAFIRRLREDNLDGAGEVIYAACPLGLVCGFACPTSDLCEGACTLNKAGQAPVRIGSLQAFIADRCEAVEMISDQETKRAVAVIGAGPSGLGCAIQLRRMGFQVEVFEKTSSIGGLADRVIPDYRLPSSAIRHDVDRLKGAGVKFHPGALIDRESARALLQEFDAIFIGTGLSADQAFRVAGLESPVEGIYPALVFLDCARRYEQGRDDAPRLGKRVVVIGGGNVALDAAVEAKRLGAEQVTVLYRRSKPEMPGWESEYLEAARLGVEFRWLSAVSSVKAKLSQLQAVTVQSMKFAQRQADGRRWVEPDLDSPNVEIPCDTLIYALGQKLDSAIAKGFGIEPVAEHGIEVDPATFQTSVPKIFAGGEAVSGGATIVYSMSQGMAAGRSIGKWLLESKPSPE